MGWCGDGWPATIGALVGALVGATGLSVVPGAWAMPPPVPPAPVHSAQRFADPSVVVTPGGLVATSTGASTPGPRPPARPGPGPRPARAYRAPGLGLRLLDLGRRPRPRRRPLAPLLLSTGLGLGPDGRCIGVAVSDRARRVPPGRQPPSRLPAAGRDPHGVRRRPRDPPDRPAPGRSDRPVAVRRPGRLPAPALQDPEPAVLDPGGPLNGRGLRTARRGGGDAQSVEILRSDGVVENPAVVRRGDGYVLFHVLRQLPDLPLPHRVEALEDLTDFSAARRQTLLTRSRTGICGPGGADLARRGGATVMFLHGWVCGPAPYAACPSEFDLVEDRSLNAEASMFAARLRWTDNDRPRLRSFSHRAEGDPARAAPARPPGPDRPARSRSG